MSHPSKEIKAREAKEGKKQRKKTFRIALKKAFLLKHEHASQRNSGSLECNIWN